MVRYTLAVAVLLARMGSSLAQVITTRSMASVYLPQAEQFFYGVMGSIVSADENKTALELGCPPHVSTDLCGYIFGDTVTYGPTTFIFNDALTSYTRPDIGGLAVWSSHRECFLDDDANVAVCTIDYISDSPGEATVRHYTVTEENLDVRRTGVTVTAGFEHLKPSPGPSRDSTTVLSTPSRSSLRSTPQSSPNTLATPTTAASSSHASETAAVSSTLSKTSTNGAMARGSNLLFGVVIAIMVGQNLGI